MDKTNLNYVALKIIEVLEEKMPGDLGYLEDKAARLREFGDNKVPTLVWARNQLDVVNLAALCQKLGITLADLEAFNRVLNKL
ncbi:TPA: hypothetical protein ACGIKE_003410 [Acinetobacter baumannii]|uniref:hypothetical protein n=1 Tax=Acinetobacter baumannii TaxID=470 RepID=UPI00338ECE72